MKIRDIRAIGLRGNTPEGGWSTEIQPDDCVHTLIVAETYEGITGWGSVFTSDQLVQGALAVLKPLYENENALEPERVTEKLHQHTFWQGRGGAITHAISGINIALWDLLGKATGQPIGRLLGGRYRERVLPYASLLIREPNILTEQLKSVRARGFRAFKVGWGSFGRKDNITDEAVVCAARNAIGSDALLMVDAGASDAFWPHGLKWALRTADMLAEYNVAWFEEPLPPDALDDFIELRRRSRIPIAGGETLTRRQSFSPFLLKGGFDIVQPDVTKVGGLSEARRIAWLAEECGIHLIPHGWNTAVGLATDLQIASAFPHTDLVEYLIGSPFIDQISNRSFQLDSDGMLPIPDLPGLGLSLNEEMIFSCPG